mgnify:CR=1 FL=1
MAENATIHDLDDQFTKSSSLSGTRSHHCFIPVSENEKKIKRLFADTHYSLMSVSDSAGPQKEPLTLEDLQPGKYVTCIYDKE